MHSRIRLRIQVQAYGHTADLCRNLELTFSYKRKNKIIEVPINKEQFGVNIFIYYYQWTCGALTIYLRGARSFHKNNMVYKTRFSMATSNMADGCKYFCYTCFFLTVKQACGSLKKGWNHDTIIILTNIRKVVPCNWHDDFPKCFLACNIN